MTATKLSSITCLPNTEAQMKATSGGVGPIDLQFFYMPEQVLSSITDDVTLGIVRKIGENRRQAIRPVGTTDRRIRQTSHKWFIHEFGRKHHDQTTEITSRRQSCGCLPIVHRGHLIGGCIEVLDWLRGTSYWPEPAQWRNAILFLETSEEAPSPQAVGCYLRCYAALGVLPLLAGLLFARPGGQVDPATFLEYDKAVQQVVVEENGLTDLPIITGMDFGHTDPMFVLPLGVQAEIDCTQQRFAIVENAVAP